MSLFQRPRFPAYVFWGNELSEVVMSSFQRVSLVAVILITSVGVRVEGMPGSREKASFAQAPVDETAVGGRISGAVTDEAGLPLDEVIVSAFGPAGVRLAVSEVRGRFTLESLEPGRYLLQVHRPGYANQTRELVSVGAGTLSVHAIALNRVESFSTPESIAANVELYRPSLKLSKWMR